MRMKLYTYVWANVELGGEVYDRASDQFSVGQIANIISYRIITVNCSGLPLPSRSRTPLVRPNNEHRRIARVV